ncbi:unnamed protein product, partial [Closterium sp. Naga37s-1]
PSVSPAARWDGGQQCVLHEVTRFHTLAAILIRYAAQVCSGHQEGEPHFGGLADVRLYSISPSFHISFLSHSPPSLSVGFHESGLRFYDVAAGKGRLAEQGDPVVVHFDVTYRSLTVVSSRQSKLLGGNRVISQPYEFSLGAKPGAERKREYAESANGLFSAQAAPKPPRALYSVVEGMREGGKRTVIVPPEQGYGDKGFAEIPPGATIQLTVELLEVKAPPS